jgi:hypothetical protein
MIFPGSIPGKNYSTCMARMKAEGRDKIEAREELYSMARIRED